MNRIDTHWKPNRYFVNTLKSNKHLNNEQLNMILFVHFSVDDLTRIDSIIWRQKMIVKRDHKIQEQ
jgi:hypothetical protein